MFLLYSLLQTVQLRCKSLSSAIIIIIIIMRLKSLNLWSLEDRRLRADLIEVFKTFHGLSVVNIHTFLKWTNPAIQGDTSWSWKKRCVATDLRQHFFTERVINTWNYLDSAVVKAGTLNVFFLLSSLNYRRFTTRINHTLDVMHSLDSRGWAIPWAGLDWWVYWVSM